MTTKFQPNQKISAGNFIVSIGSDGTKDVAIFSKSTGDFVKLSSAKRSKKLSKIKRFFGSDLSCFNTFCFSWLGEDAIDRIILILKD